MENLATPSSHANGTCSTSKGLLDSKPFLSFFFSHIISKSSAEMDPLQVLPSETVSNLLSLLPASSRTRCESLSSAWNKAIISDPSLHRTIDLTGKTILYPKDDSEEAQVEEMMMLLVLYSKRSKQTLEDVSLDLSHFWDSFDSWRWQMENIERARPGWEEESRFAKLLRLLKESEGSMKRIKIIVQEHPIDTPEGQSTDLVLAHSIVKILKANFSNLRDIQLFIPSKVEIKSGSTGKTMCLMNSDKSLEFQEDEEPFDEEGYSIVEKEVMPLIDEILEFTDGDLLHFKYSGDTWDATLGKENVEIILRAETFKTNLQSLDLGPRVWNSSASTRVIDVFMACQSLSTFRAKVSSEKIIAGEYEGGNEEEEEENDEVLQFKVPIEAISSTPMKELDLTLIRVDLKWDEGFTRKLGTQLTEFSLSYFTDQTDDKLSPLRPSDLSTLFSLNSNSLTTIRLGTAIWEDQTVLQLNSLPQVDLPNLRLLSLACPSIVTVCLLTKLKISPELICLEILVPRAEGSYRLEKKRNYFSFSEVLWPIIRASSSSLSELAVEGVKFEEGDLPNSNFHFPNLKKLHLKGSAGFIELFSNFTYPKVEDVKVDGWGDREDRGFLEDHPQTIWRQFTIPDSDSSDLDSEDDEQEGDLEESELEGGVLEEDD